MSKSSFKVDKTVVLTPQATLPADPQAGEMVFDSSVNKFKMYDGSSWAIVNSGTVIDNTYTVTVKDTLFTVQDNTDVTKQMQFELSGITAGQTRTLTVPDASTTLMGTDVSQNVSNKNLIDASTNIVDSVDPTKQIKFDAAGTTGTSTTITGSQTVNRVLTLPDATDTLVAENVAQTLASKALVDASTSIVDSVDPTKKILFDAGGTTGTTSTITGAQTANRVLTLPDATTTLLGTDVAQVVTNKDVDGGTASNTSRITLPKAAKTTLDGLTRKQGTILFDTTSNKPYYDDGTNLQLIGSGSGGGSTNFLSNGDAETGTTGWFIYQDNTASSRPEDGTGTGGSIGWAASTSSPLTGTNSFILTKNAGLDRRGHGVSYDFTIDAAHKAKVLKIEMDYIVESGTFTAGTSTTDSDIIVYMYDVTNSTLIEPSSIKLLSNSTTISDRFSATFQTSATGTQYRLILHIATTNTALYTVKFDNISVSPSTYVFGTPITDWQSYTPTYTGLGTVSSNISHYRRVGDSLQVSFSVAAGTTTATLATISLPSGVSLDSSKIATNTEVGKLSTNNTPFSGGLFTVTTTPTVVYFSSDSSSFSAGANGSTWASGTVFGGMFEVPILGWSSSVQMSDSADTRVVDFVGYVTAGTALTALTTDIPLGGIDKDTHGAWNGTQYKIPVPGDYQVNFSLAQTTATSSTYYYYINGTIGKQIGGNPSSTTANARGSTIIPNLKTGDLVSFRTSTSSITTVSSSDLTTSISRISGPSAISQVESINARYTSTAGGSIGTSPTQQSFATKSYDSHGAWNGNTFTVPSPGKYEVTAGILTANLTLTVGQAIQLIVYKNGAQYSVLSRPNGMTSGVQYRVTGTDTIECVAGDTISIYANSSVATSQDTTAGFNYITIKRVGN